MLWIHVLRYLQLQRVCRTVPAGEPDALGADGLTGFTKGLKVACEAKPSLPIVPVGEVNLRVQ